jgi:methionyl-tRNA formyltransferase
MMVRKMDEGLDTGPVAMSEKVAIHPDMTAGELHDELMVVGAGLMLRALLALEEGSLMLDPQPAEGVTYARKIDKAETRIDWSRPGREVHNHIRGLSPFPGAWCEMPIAGRLERIKLLRSTLSSGDGLPGTVLDDSLTIACGNGAVRLEELQRAGGKALRADDFLRGAKIEKGLVVS